LSINQDQQLHDAGYFRLESCDLPLQTVCCLRVKKIIQQFLPHAFICGEWICIAFQWTSLTRKEEVWT